MPDVLVYPEPEVMARAAAEQIAGWLHEAAEARGAASLVLTGGSTPGPTYRALATDFRDALAWTRVHVFWGDERCVPPEHPESNERLARTTMLDALPIPSEQVHPMRCSGNPDAAARVYADTLRAFFEGREPWFDVTLLGLGDDGHVASLFPGSPALDEPSGWVAHTEAPPTSPVRDRLTLTLPALNASRHVLFLVSGSGKRDALRRVFESAADPSLPVARIRPAGTLTWMVDEAARHGA